MATKDDSRKNTKSGGALDFYNDDMSRDAVGRLFTKSVDGDAEDTAKEEEELVSGFNARRPADDGDLPERVRPHRPIGGAEDYDISLYQNRDAKTLAHHIQPAASSRGTVRKTSEPEPTLKPGSYPIKRSGGGAGYFEIYGFQFSPAKMIAAIAFVVLLIIIVMLIATILGKNRQLADAQVNADALATLQSAQVQWETVDKPALEADRDDWKTKYEELTATPQPDAQTGSVTPADGTDTAGTGVTAPAGNAGASTAAQSADTWPKTYVVAQGDYLSKIAKQFYGSGSDANIKKIADANNITDPSKISVGVTITIPAP